MESRLHGCVTDRMSQVWMLYMRFCASHNHHGFLPSDFMGHLETELGQHPRIDRSVHGKIFELGVGECLAHKGNFPVFHQARLRHFPLVDFDWLLYHPSSPVTVSCKTSLRDRWKMSALEALLMKNAFPNAECVLVVNDTREAAKLSSKLGEWDIGISRVLCSTSPKFDEFIHEVWERRFQANIALPPISEAKVVPRAYGGPQPNLPFPKEVR